LTLARAFEVVTVVATAGIPGVAAAAASDAAGIITAGQLVAPAQMGGWAGRDYTCF
jgi:hypothetical protein